MQLIAIRRLYYRPPMNGTSIKPYFTAVSSLSFVGIHPENYQIIKGLCLLIFSSQLFVCFMIIGVRFDALGPQERCGVKLNASIQASFYRGT